MNLAMWWKTIVVCGLAVCSTARAQSTDEAANAPETPVIESPPTAPELAIQRNLVYGRADEPMHRADVYRPSTSDKSTLFPGVLMIHGGAWIAGDKFHDAQHAKRLAKKGFVVVVVNYRLAPKHSFPAQIDDCFLALKWLTQNQKELQIQTEALGVWGYSAGGHLAALMATQPRDGYVRMRACVAGGAPCDLTRLPEKSTLLSSFLGGTRRQFPDRYIQASPISHVTSDDPPFFLFHGSGDRLVPRDNADRMIAALTNQGVTHEFYEVPKKAHLMTFLDQEATEKSFEFLVQHLQTP